MTVITDEKIDLTKDGTPIVEIEDTGETTFSGAWLTAPEVHLKHSTDNANSEGVLGIIRFKGTTKNDLGIASDPGSVDLVQIQGRTVGQGNAQRLSDVIGALSFRGMDGAGNFAELMSIEGKNLKIVNGGGIDFSSVSGSASGSTSALLDDYEEGTWTPTWVVSNGSITAHSHKSGFYRKIGNVVYIWGYISWGGSSGTINSDSLRVGGLPYQSITSGFGQSGNQAGGVHMFAEGLWGSNAPQGGRIQNNSATISITHSRTGTGSSNVTVGDMTKSQNYSQTVFYGQYLT